MRASARCAGWSPLAEGSASRPLRERSPTGDTPTILLVNVAGRPRVQPPAVGSFRPLSATATHTPDQRARALAEAPQSVVVDGVSKAFRLPHERYSTLKERALHPLSSSRYDVLQALEDVSFGVQSGEFFGVVGRNGSGKSTLLKCLAGIYGIDRGNIDISGRLSPFIELGVGFNPDLTARDNVLINAIMLGLTRKEARRRFDEIIEFAELEEFVDLKLKNYSSGMSVRLGFSVAVQVDADILLVDEVLAVGDAAFQRKCFDQFERLRAEGRTIMLVTHDMNSVERFCDRALLLERGRVIDDRIARRGRAPVRRGQLRLPRRQRHAVGSGRRRRPDQGPWCERPSGERTHAGRRRALPRAPGGRVPRDRRASSSSCTSATRSGTRCSSPRLSRRLHGHFNAGERVTILMSFDNWLAPSRYTITPKVARRRGRAVLDNKEDVVSLIVEGPIYTGGVTDLPTSSRWCVRERRRPLKARTAVRRRIGGRPAPFRGT